MTSAPMQWHMIPPDAWDTPASILTDSLCNLANGASRAASCLAVISAAEALTLE